MPSTRLTSALAGAVLTGVVLAVSSPASAAQLLGNVGVAPTEGNDATLLRGAVESDCPPDTTDSFWTIDGPGLPPETAFLPTAYAGDDKGDGLQAFRGASVSNIRTVNPESFTTSGQYRIRFNCFGATSVVATYEAVMAYRPGSGGSFTVAPAVAGAPAADPNLALPVDERPVAPGGPAAGAPGSTPGGPSAEPPSDPLAAAPSAPGAGSSGAAGGDGDQAQAQRPASADSDAGGGGPWLVALAALVLAVAAGAVLGRRRGWFPAPRGTGLSPR
ncbi:MAG TPA: hypothetical protein VNU26_03805 [Mycobacteriales bacterium]|nr:hypothetical protein [Mycobacteriales bacterium]